LGEYKKIVKDKACNVEQIQQALTNADQRVRMLILLLSSTGCRIGGLPDLTFGSLTKIPEYGIYRITFYENTNSEYYTYCTRECADTGIDAYLQFRQRFGEKITFNEDTQQWQPSKSPLFRTQFDYNDSLQAKQPKPMNINSLRSTLAFHMVKCGLRVFEHPTVPKKINRVRKKIPLANGFRKFVISSFVRARVGDDIRQKLVDHRGGYLDESYLRLEESEILQEYMKAESYLTIDPTVRLSQEVQTLRIDKSRMEQMLDRISTLENKILNED
jgi:hypothetical protein